jgi:tetratricopeptide (TPR) repeat protein
MSDNYPLNEQLHRYFDGELSGNEKAGFEAELAASPELREALNALKLSRYAVNRQGVLQQVSAIHAEFAGRKDEVQEAVPVKKINWMRYAVAIAAAVTIFIAIMWFLPSTGKNNTDASQLYASVYKPYDDAQLRSNNDNNLEKQYQLHNHKQVIAAYAQLQNPGAKDNLLAACAYMETGDHASATKLLLLLQENNRVNATTSFSDDAEYYLALCYLKQGKTNEAVKLFTTINNNPGHLYSDKVTPAFMAQLNKLLQKK